LTSMSTLKLPEIALTPDLAAAEYDAVVVVAPSVQAVGQPALKKALSAVAEVDKSADGGCFLAPAGADVAGKRVVYSGTGALDQDIDDVRRFGEAMEKGIKRALQAGAKRPLLAMSGTDEFTRSKLVTILGAFKAMYVPLEMREDVPAKAVKVEKFGVLDEGGKLAKDTKLAAAIEEGKTVCRDIGGSDPERMAPPRVAEYCTDLFKGTGIKVEVIQGHETLKKEYPCLAAVDRAASVIDRHQGCVIWLTYEPEGPVNQTVMMVGKGITYDTGGADIKAGGIMAGMSRDKCGAAVVAGFLKTVDTLKPKGLKVVGAMAMVRNSVGANCYVSDEIITARSGMRLRVGNTDAEGRMAMVDVLCHMREKALKEVNPHLMTFATLTGHAVVAMGPYTALVDNGPARAAGFSRAMFETGEECGDQFEISSLRRDDYEKVWDGSKEFVDVLQCNNLPSTRTPRGHQLPAAFMHLVSGLDKHQSKCDKPLKYTHFDVAGSSGGLPGPTTGAGVTAMTMHFVEPRM